MHHYLFDSAGSAYAEIRTDNDGNQNIRQLNQSYISGRYNVKTNTTIDGSGKYIGKGNLLSSLVSPINNY